MLPPSSSFRKVACLAACSLGLAALPLRAADAPATSHDWPVYNGNTNGDHYSPLAQINRENVTGLKEAWRFDTGEFGGLETNPLIIDGVVYAITPTRKVVALDAVSIVLPAGFASLTDRDYRRSTSSEDMSATIDDPRVYRLRLSLMFGIDLSADEVAGLGLF